MTKIVCCSFVLLHMFLYGSCSLSDVTSDLFGAECQGIVSAFGDVNADKATDVFLLSEDGKTISILYAKIDFDLRKDEVSFTKSVFLRSDNVISSVVPGDFNSDSQMDVLVTWKTLSPDSRVNVDIYSGSSHVDDPKTRKPFLSLRDLKDQPAVIDWNGDMIPDLFGELGNSSRAVWVFGNNGSFSLELITNGTAGKLPELKKQSSAFLDLNGDMTADLCAVSTVNGQTIFEFWYNQEGNLLWNKSISAPQELKCIGQASFADLNGNHQTNIILPGFLDEKCTESAIFVWSYNKYAGEEGKWHKLDVNFKVSNEHHSTFEKSLSHMDWLDLPISLRFGDFNLDGLPDALAVLSETIDGITNSSTFLLINEECEGGNCDGFSRTLSVDYNQRLHRNEPVIAAFFDIMENGALDVLLTEVSEDNKLVVRAIKQDFSGDASFLKVLVTSGYCFKDCPNGHKPYGVNQVGPTAKFETTNSEGGGLMGVASQLTQSAYFPLQLPYMLFGLGRTPNFVDHLEVGIPYPSGENPRKHSWTTIIPNSYVIVLPYPLDDPDSWKHELYITPSRLVLLTGVSLLGTCAFIAIIVGLLQWKERNEDKKEKLQEAQRFHFDAM